jgi:hypothetical protein
VLVLGLFRGKKVWVKLGLVFTGVKPNKVENKVIRQMILLRRKGFAGQAENRGGAIQVFKLQSTQSTHATKRIRGW